MKFECTTQDLLNAAALTVRFVEKRANLPVLSAVLMVAEKGRLILRATNLECGVEVVVDAKVEETGIAATSASVLVGFLQNARGKTVSGILKGEVLKLETERASASLKTVPHEDFPVLPKVAATTSFKLKAGDLVRAIRSVAHCASTSAVKPELQSVLLFGEGGKLISAGTDSFRLAEKVVALRDGGNVSNLLIPTRNAVELSRIAEPVTGDLEVYYNEHQVSTHAGGVYYTSRLIDGAFPNYRQIIPKTFATEVVILREDFHQALKSLSVFSDKFFQVSLTIDPAHKSILLSSRNPDVGEQTSTLRATITGEGYTMNFNSRYLADSLQAITGESIRIQSNGPGKPILIKDAADESYLYLAMPMNR